LDWPEVKIAPSSARLEGLRAAISGRSPALSGGHSNVGYAQVPAVEAQARYGKSSVFSDIRVLVLVRQLPFAPDRCLV